MPEFPTTIEELEQLISDYMAAHVSEQIGQASTAQIAEAVASYMQNYGAAIEDNGESGDVPLVADNALDPDNASIPMARLSNGVPVSYFQARVSALVLAAARLVVQLGASNLMVLHASSETIATISPNILHVWSYARSLTIFLERGVADRVNEYMLQFMVEGDGFSLSLPSGVLWMNDEEPEWEDGCTYQVSIVNNLAVAAMWEGEAEIGGGTIEPVDTIKLRVTGRTGDGQDYEFILTDDENESLRMI